MTSRSTTALLIAGLLLAGCGTGGSSVPVRPGPAGSAGVAEFPADCVPERLNGRAECRWVTSSGRNFIAVAEDLALSPSGMFDPQDLPRIRRNPEDFLRLVLYPSTADWIWDRMEDMTTLSESMLGAARLPEGADACFEARFEGVWRAPGEASGREASGKSLHCVAMREADDSVRMVSLLFIEPRRPGTGPAPDFDARADAFLGTRRFPR